MIRHGRARGGDAPGEVREGGGGGGGRLSLGLWRGRGGEAGRVSVRRAVVERRTEWAPRRLGVGGGRERRRRQAVGAG
jgi:hypothetical protein